MGDAGGRFRAQVAPADDGMGHDPEGRRRGPASAGGCHGATTEAKTTVIIAVLLLFTFLAIYLWRENFDLQDTVAIAIIALLYLAYEATSGEVPHCGPETRALACVESTED